MAERYRIIYNPAAAKQLNAIFDYIEQDSSQNAVAMVKRIVEAIENLQFMPQRHPVLDWLPSSAKDVRSFPLPPYLIRYRIEAAKQSVRILSVRHGARRPGL